MTLLAPLPTNLPQLSRQMRYGGSRTAEADEEDEDFGKPLDNFYLPDFGAVI